MNCANHPQTPAVAYCRTCGKPLCNQCTRQVMGVIYCENCLAERVTGTAPPPSQFQPAPGYQGPVQPVSAGPNPALAGVLGAIPFGVGAVYNGQYAKGLAHLLIFILRPARLDLWNRDSSFCALSNYRFRKDCQSHPGESTRAGPVWAGKHVQPRRSA